MPRGHVSGHVGKTDQGRFCVAINVKSNENSAHLEILDQKFVQAMNAIFIPFSTSKMYKTPMSYTNMNYHKGNLVLRYMHFQYITNITFMTRA